MDMRSTSIEKNALLLYSVEHKSTPSSVVYRQEKLYVTPRQSFSLVIYDGVAASEKIHEIVLSQKQAEEWLVANVPGAKRGEIISKVYDLTRKTKANYSINNKINEKLNEFAHENDLRVSHIVEIALLNYFCDFEECKGLLDENGEWSLVTGS